MNALQILGIFIIAFLAGAEGVLDQFQFHQPLFSCTMIGLITGHLTEGIILGGSLQMLALGWANVGAAVAPDVALAGVASAILMALGLNGGTTDVQNTISTSIAVAVPLSVAGLFLTMIVRTISITIVHAMDARAEVGDARGIDMLTYLAIALQGLRIAIPALALCFVAPDVVTGALNAMPAWLASGMSIGGGMIAAVGYAMIINMMATKETWPFFALGFVIATIKDLTLIGLGIVGLVLGLVYVGLKETKGAAVGAGSGDPLGDILNDYE